MKTSAALVLTAMIAVVSFGVAAYASVSESEEEAFFCTADARLDAPDGWLWQRDGANDCAWTLYDDQGNEAPDSVYEAAGEEPPPTQPLDAVVIVAAIVGIVALGASIMLWVRLRGETPTA